MFIFAFLFLFPFVGLIVAVLYFRFLRIVFTVVTLLAFGLYVAKHRRTQYPVAITKQAT